MNIDTSSLMELNMLQLRKSKEQQLKTEQATLSNRNNGSQNKTDKELKDACTDFQAILIKQMLDSMRNTINKDGLLPTSHAEKIFEDMLYDEYAQKMSKTAGFGLDTMMYEQLKQGMGI